MMFMFMSCDNGRGKKLFVKFANLFVVEGSCGSYSIAPVPVVRSVVVVVVVVVVLVVVIVVVVFSSE